MLVLSVVTVHLEGACPTNLLIGNIHRLVCLCRCTLNFVTEGYIRWVSPTGMCLCGTKQIVVVCVHKCLLFVYTQVPVVVCVHKCLLLFVYTQVPVVVCVHKCLLLYINMRIQSVLSCSKADVDANNETTVYNKH